MPAIVQDVYLCHSFLTAFLLRLHGYVTQCELWLATIKHLIYCRSHHLFVQTDIRPDVQCFFHYCLRLQEDVFIYVYTFDLNNELMLQNTRFWTGNYGDKQSSPVKKLFGLTPQYRPYISVFHPLTNYRIYKL